MRDIEPIRRKHRILVNEITILKNKLNDSNKKKEFFFIKKEDLKKEISSLIIKMRTVKLKNDEINQNVVTIKGERDKYNERIKDLLGKLNKLNKEKREIFRKYKFKEDPYKIQRKIDAIESRLETETSFENEKKLMKQLNEFRRIYSESKIKELIDKMDKLSNELDSTKKKANEFHKKLMANIKGKDGYSEFIKLSREINGLRTTQEEAFNNFITYKKEYVITNNFLRQKLKQSSVLKTKIDKVSRKSKQKNISVILRKKTKTVLDKFRKKKKLTTEDILVLQGEHK